MKFQVLDCRSSMQWCISYPHRGTSTYVLLLYISHCLFITMYNAHCTRQPDSRFRVSLSYSVFVTVCCLIIFGCCGLETLLRTLYTTCYLVAVVLGRWQLYSYSLPSAFDFSQPDQWLYIGSKALNDFIRLPAQQQKEHQNKSVHYYTVWGLTQRMCYRLQGSQQRSVLRMPLSSRNSTTVLEFIRILFTKVQGLILKSSNQESLDNNRYVLALYTLGASCKYMGCVRFVDTSIRRLPIRRLFMHFNCLQPATNSLGGFWGAEPPSFSIQFMGFGFSEPGIRCFSVQFVDELRVDQTAVDESGVKQVHTCSRTKGASYT